MTASHLGPATQPTTAGTWPTGTRLGLVARRWWNWIAWSRIGLMLLVVAAAGCLYLGLTLPIVKLTELYIFSDEHSLISAVQALLMDGELALATLVIIFSIVMPSCKLAYLFVLAVLPVGLGDRHRTLVRLEWFGKWSMHDVLILALTIVYLRAEGVSQAASLPGVYWFAASVILIMMSYGWARRQAGRAVHSDAGAVEATTLRTLSQGRALMSGSRRLLVALLTLAATSTLVLGVSLPAIQLTKLYWWTDQHSILSAIGALFRDGEYFLACLIFLFSVCVPVIKLIYLMVVATVTPERPLARAVMLDRLEGLGKWSMMDVLVLALVIFYVNASYVADATALPGVYWFSASVFLTMAAYTLAKGGLTHGRKLGRSPPKGWWSARKNLAPIASDRHNDA